jgi:hypothetical protein
LDLRNFETAVQIRDLPPGPLTRRSAESAEQADDRARGFGRGRPDFQVQSLAGQVDAEVEERADR